jgi:hypothetical protein
MPQVQPKHPDGLLQSFLNTGTMLSHDYVTSLYVNGLAVPGGIKLYGNQKKCQEKEVEFKTNLQLA